MENIYDENIPPGLALQRAYDLLGHLEGDRKEIQTLMYNMKTGYDDYYDEDNNWSSLNFSNKPSFRNDRFIVDRDASREIVQSVNRHLWSFERLYKRRYHGEIKYEMYCLGNEVDSIMLEFFKSIYGNIGLVDYIMTQGLIHIKKYYDETLDMIEPDEDRILITYDQNFDDHDISQ